MRTIAWLVDQPDWAYAVRARAIAHCLPEYHHRLVCYSREGFLPLLGADIVICPDPRLFPYFGARQKVVLNLNAIKLFTLSL